VTADDVVIAGAGPAGSVAALLLARAGARVRILDRARFPRDKLCGDTLNPGAMARLDALGLAARVRSQALPVAGMIVTGPAGARIVGEYGCGVYGAALTRRTLDELLLDAAIAAGAVFEPDTAVCGPLLAGDGTTVTGVRIAGRTGERQLRSRVVVAADGRRSRLAFDLGLAACTRRPRRWAFGAYYTDVGGVTGCGEMHIRAGSYIGVAPLPGGLTNLCVVRELGSGEAARADPQRVVQLAVASDPVLHERFAAARRVTPVTVLGPLAVDAHAAGTPGLLLAGDAAGFIDPMTGDGLRFAIRGAELAARCAFRELETGRSMHHELAAARRSEFAGKWRVNRMLRRLVASPRTVRIAASLATVWETPVRSLIAIAGDVVTGTDSARTGH
jgi:flavin-dependent dehydrogenase